jgi:SAM-dependent methyltransferase
MDALNLHLPERVADKAETFLRESAPHLPVKRLQTQDVLDVGGLRCLDLTLAGSLTRARAPYAYPFLDDRIRTEFAGRPHARPGADFVMLGGGLRRFLGLAVENAAANQVPEILVRPFRRIGGRLSQEPGADDVKAELTRTTANYNQEFWEELEGRLAGLPEERWNELGANTSDLYPVFAPLIGRYLCREPRLIVDIGCGLGQTARTLATVFPQARVLGIDVSPQAVDIARKAFDLPNIEFQAADISRGLGLARSSADLVVSTNALMYAADQLGAAADIFGSLRPDGLCLNNCRMGPSHSYWDFPRGLLLPATFQLQPRDWTQTAARFGLSSRVMPTPSGLGFNPLYYHAYGLRDFRTDMEGIGELIENDPPAEYAPYLSHAVLIHSRRAEENALSHFPWTDHVGEVRDCLLSMPGNHPRVQQTTVVSWLYCFASLRLFPEAAQFFQAVVPEAAGILGSVFNAATLDRLAAKTPAAPA